MMRPSRDQTGLELAQVWAKRGTCVRRRVGCVLMDADGYQLSAGYNGPAAGEPHCIETPCPGAGLLSGTGLDECQALHAEWGAIARCPDIRRIHTCYVTSSPCVTCVKMLMGTGCRRVVFADEYPHSQARVWWLSRADREWIHLPTPTLVDLTEPIAQEVAAREGWRWNAMDEVEDHDRLPSRNRVRSMVYETLKLDREGFGR